MVRLNKKQIDAKKKWVYDYVGLDTNAADSSKMDANANVEKKNVAVMGAEFHKDINIQTNRAITCDYISKHFSKEMAEEYIRQLESHEIYCHDETHPFLPYCVAINSDPFILEGTKGIGGNTSAPKSLKSYCGGYVNLIYAIASQFAGAVADVSMLRDFHYFAKKDFGGDYLNTNTKEISDSLSQIIYSLNMPAGTRGFQSIFYNTSVFDEYYFEGLYEHALYPDGSAVIAEWEGINKLQKFFLKWFNAERKKALLTFPVITAALKLKDGLPESEDWQNTIAEEFAEGNSFFVYMDKNATSLSSCCRLRNDISDQINEFSYSLGAGGVSTGSMNVITINMNRLVQDGRSLEDELEKIYKYQIGFASWFHYLKDRGQLPAYDAGFIAMSKQYLTIGINGLVEAAEYLGMEISNNDEYTDWLASTLKIFSEKNKEASKKYSEMLGYKVMFNTEMIPAESAGAKLYQWDKADGYVVPEDRNLYNSYFYIPQDQINVLDKIALHGKKTIEHLDGGSALHINLENHLTKEGWLKLINITAKAGANYWTYNVKSTLCNDCGFISKRDLDNCPKCGSENVDKATRVIGYLRREKNFSAPRREEAKKRFYHTKDLSK